jgi:hypothetical protein
MISRRAWLYVGPAVMCLIDLAVTLAYQPSEYWHQGYQFVHESNPAARWFLQIHPLAFLGASLLWILAFSAAIFSLRFATARIVALAVLLAHAFGASTWLIREPYGWLWCFGVWLLARYLFGRFWDQSPTKRPVNRGTARHDGLG